LFAKRQKAKFSFAASQEQPAEHEMLTLVTAQNQERKSALASVSAEILAPQTREVQYRISDEKIG
jgi:hypothetical protein